MRCSRAASAAICAVARRARCAQGRAATTAHATKKTSSVTANTYRRVTRASVIEAALALRLVLVLAARAMHDADDRLGPHVDDVGRCAAACVAAWGERCAWASSAFSILSS